MTYRLIDGLDGQWLVETSDGCTCAPYAGTHEKSCGLEPLGKVDDLLDKAALSGPLAKQLARARAEYIQRDLDRRIRRWKARWDVDPDTERMSRWTERASDRFASIVNDESRPVDFASAD